MMPTHTDMNVVDEDGCELDDNEPMDTIDFNDGENYYLMSWMKK